MLILVRWTGLDIYHPKMPRPFLIKAIQKDLKVVDHFRGKNLTENKKKVSGFWGGKCPGASISQDGLVFGTIPVNPGGPAVGEQNKLVRKDAVF